jgi:hypothetical protein
VLPQACSDTNCDRTTSGRGSSTRISLSNSWRSENIINTHKYNINIRWSLSISYYNLGLHVKFTKGWSLIDTSKDTTEFTKQVSLTFKTFSSLQKRMLSIDALSLRILVQSPTLIGLDFLLATLIAITKKRKQFLTCTQETTRAKLEWLHSARLIHGDQKISTRHARF